MLTIRFNKSNVPVIDNLVQDTSPYLDFFSSLLMKMFYVFLDFLVYPCVSSAQSLPLCTRGRATQALLTSLKSGFLFVKYEIRRIVATK